MTDPFALLGVPHSLDLDEDQLEQAFFRRSRDLHPDHQEGGGDAEAQLRSAELNEAYRQLADPWLRARALVELRQPGAMQECKQLDPEFLMSAMELAEQVSSAAGEERNRLEHAIEDAITGHRERLQAAVSAESWSDAARILHQARYHLKAQEDLEVSP